MHHKVFTIYDQAAKAHLPPFFLPEKSMAERTFADCVNDKSHQFGKHPEDYTLLCIGQFDDVKGELIPDPVPEVIGTGVRYLNSREGYTEKQIDALTEQELNYFAGGELDESATN